MPETAKVPELRTRKPTGKPPWPLLLVAGPEKSGKSWCASEFSASDLVDRTFWIEIGEGAADMYGALPGARYEIAEHDGSYQGIGYAIWAATQQPRPNGKPHAIVVDAVSTLWEMLSDEAQSVANARARRAAEAKGRKAPVGDRTITADLWNAAKGRWKRVIDMLRKYDGPVILLARLELVSVMDGDKPTAEKFWKVKAEKSLPFEVDAIVRFTAPRKPELTGVRSTVLQMEPGGVMPLPDFSIDKLLRDLGLADEGATAARTYVAPAPNAAELAAEAGDERRATRSQPTRPAGDEWSTARPANANGASRPRSCNPAQRKQLGDLALAKLGLSGEKNLLGAFGDAVGRALAKPGDLTYDEAKQLIERLTATPDYHGAAGAPPATKADATTPPPPPKPVGPKVLVDLCAAIDKAAVGDLEGIWQDAKAAFEGGKLTKDQAAKVEYLCDQRYLQLSGEVANAS